MYLCANFLNIQQAQKDICEIKEEAATLNHSVQTLQRETDEKFDQIFMAMGVENGIVASAPEESCSNGAGEVDHSIELEERKI